MYLKMSITGRDNGRMNMDTGRRRKGWRDWLDKEVFRQGDRSRPADRSREMGACEKALLLLSTNWVVSM